jgi:K+-sensing histidine kinase KdpD
VKVHIDREICVRRVAENTNEHCRKSPRTTYGVGAVKQRAVAVLVAARVGGNHLCRVGVRALEKRSCILIVVSVVLRAERRITKGATQKNVT